MARSHVVLVPGIREGWGRVVIEANAFGTPAIGYAVNGLVDSIRHGYNGLVTEPNPTAMAEAIGKLYLNPALRKKLSKNAVEWAIRFRWDKSAEEFEKILLGMMDNG
jgi:glycosyltransferase involved in cell wall biosynthesis